jgi:2-desacetyl-2-hydroxyethyl bacteriochlorophyllide A dehydrogenase
MPKKLSLVGPRQIRLTTYEDAPLQPHQIRAQAIQSGVSHGTELNLYRGTSPFADKHFDPDLRLFLPGRGDAPPPELGYEWVGRVTEVGPDVIGFREGDLIHLLLPHQETHTVDPFDITFHDHLEPLPPDVSPDQAIFLALAGVALQAIHDAHIKTGDRVAIFGLGVIGLLAVQLARINGAGWIDAVDLIPHRREMALTYGADQVIDPLAEDAGLVIKSTGKRPGADVAIELSGNYAALHQAIRSVRMGGLVVAGGFYQKGAEGLRLGEEWHHNRITMVSSMAAWDCPHRDYPLWDRTRINETVTELLATGRLQTAGMITHRFPFARAREAYDLIDKHPDQTIKVVLTY